MIGNNSSEFGDYYEAAAAVYSIAIPVLVAICIFCILINLIIIIVCILTGHQNWRKTLTLKLTLSLAATDAWSSLHLAIGLINNSYFPIVLRVHTLNCYTYLLEALRLGGMVSSVLHILALTVNHYVAIAAPIRYQTLSGQTIPLRILILTLWIAPPLFFLGAFLVNYERTFGDPTCNAFFMKSIGFSLIVFAVIAFPLLIITTIYFKMGVVLYRLQKRLSEHPMASGSQRRKGSVLNPHTLQPTSSQSLIDHQKPLTRQKSRHEKTLQRNIKMAVTALLIVGTFLLAWIPGVIFFAMTCSMCPYPITTLMALSPKSVYIVGISCNFLMISKGLLNPLIYALRVPEIKGAFVMVCGRGRRPPSTTSNRFSRFSTGFFRSKIDLNGVSVMNGNVLPPGL